MSSTNGGKAKKFDWELITPRISIQNHEGRVHEYELTEIFEIINWLKDKFSDQWFPLANNVELMSNGTEKDGLGTAILNSKPNDITHAQGASYLGVVLQEIGIFEWNHAKRGIEWKIVNPPKTISELQQMLTGKNG
ncbi:hypothetical protein [Pontiella agarivorans]|uniref:Uncharacterized protein n=1 Tax=Pontiella agarivorans TaxID=3038953 RepID=A0ABU5N1A8_9BACT|nr:hypothetical protein [Pontiella agarivorans]MDZ8120136.1 hypothetical protein [Pontiella agarivorans]